MSIINNIRMIVLENKKTYIVSRKKTIGKKRPRNDRDTEENEEIEEEDQGSEPESE